MGSRLDKEVCIKRMIMMKKTIYKIIRNFIKPSVNLKEVIIDIVGSCNALCPFCPRQMIDNPPKGFMSKEIFYEILEQLEGFPEVKVVRLYAVGEPLLHPNFEEYVNSLHDLGYSIGLSSNMSLAEKHFDTLMKLKNIQFSIEGWDQNTYELYRKGLNYDKVYNNIVLFDKITRERREKGENTPKRSIHLLLTKKTNVKLFLEKWRPYTDTIVITPMYPMPIWDTNLKAFKFSYSSDINDDYLKFEIREDYKFCRYLFNVITLNYKGEIALCCGDFEYKINFGNYRQLKNDFYKNTEINKIRKEFLDQKVYVCKNCNQFLKANSDEIFQYFPELSNIRDENIIVRL